MKYLITLLLISCAAIAQNSPCTVARERLRVNNLDRTMARNMDAQDMKSELTAPSNKAKQKEIAEQYKRKADHRKAAEAKDQAAVKTSCQ